jgi:hypothetical protein
MDQAAIAALTLLAVASLGIYWVGQGGAGGRLIELDREPRKSISFQVDLNEAYWAGRTTLKVLGK